MMISLNINVEESAYDKIIYFLSHLKDDVTILDDVKINDTLETSKNRSSKKLQRIKILERLSTLDRLVAQSNNSVRVTKEIAINTDEMSDDISRY